jgi:hypothetical protein
VKALTQGPERRHIGCPEWVVRQVVIVDPCLKSNRLQMVALGSSIFLALSCHRARCCGVVGSVKDKRQLSQIYSSLLEFNIFPKQPMANWSQQYAVHGVEGRSWEREEKPTLGRWRQTISAADAPEAKPAEICRATLRRWSSVAAAEK